MKKKSFFSSTRRKNSSSRFHLFGKSIIGGYKKRKYSFKNKTRRKKQKGG